MTDANFFDAPAPEGHWSDPPPRFSFEPERDITAYELGFILRTFTAQLHVDKKIFDHLPAEVARHFKPIEKVAP